MCLTYVQYYIYKRRGDRDVVGFFFCFFLFLFVFFYVCKCSFCPPCSLKCLCVRVCVCVCICYFLWSFYSVYVCLSRSFFVCLFVLFSYVVLFEFPPISSFLGFPLSAFSYQVDVFQLFFLFSFCLIQFSTSR